MCVPCHVTTGARFLCGLLAVAPKAADNKESAFDRNISLEARCVFHQRRALIVRIYMYTYTSAPV